jgi:hypothetical protein
MTIVHAPVNAKYHWQDSHTQNTLSCVPLWASVGVSPIGIKIMHIQYAALAGLSGEPGWQGDRLYGFRLVWFLLTGCRSLVCGILLVLLWVGDVESNPGPYRGPCVICGLTLTENAKALLRCSEGCDRESYYEEACSGLQKWEQHQGN